MKSPLQQPSKWCPKIFTFESSILGCKIILPVIGFECYLCKVFIRNETDIEDHVASIPHLKIYEVV